MVAKGQNDENPGLTKMMSPCFMGPRLITNFMLSRVCDQIKGLCHNDQIDFVHNVMNRVKFRQLCLESAEHNLANISETNCPKMIVFGK